MLPGNRRILFQQRRNLLENPSSNAFRTATAISSCLIVATLQECFCVFECLMERHGLAGFYTNRPAAAALAFQEECMGQERKRHIKLTKNNLGTPARYPWDTRLHQNRAILCGCGADFYSVSCRGGRNKGGRKQMRANANKRRQTLTNASERRGANASKRGQTQTNAHIPLYCGFLHPPLQSPNLPLSKKSRDFSRPQDAGFPLRRKSLANRDFFCEENG